MGGLIAWPLSLFAARCLSQNRPVETRFSAFFLCLTAGTIGTTAFLFALDYRAFYAQWHATTGTRTWMFQFAFTSLAAFYQFLVLGFAFICRSVPSRSWQRVCCSRDRTRGNGVELHRHL